MTWSELGSYSDRLGTHIVQNTQNHIPVIVYGHKDPLMIASFVACSKSGRAYCPVDISVSVGRLQDIVREVGPSLIVAPEELPPIDCKDALVLSKDRPDGSVRGLTAFLVMNAPAQSFTPKDTKALKVKLSTNLQSYMIPKRPRLVDDFP
jgi:non-ribosomal peptide synthetase component F